MKIEENKWRQGKKIWIKKQFLIITITLLTIQLNAQIISKTDISFSVDEDGNLNSNISIPIYYDDSKQFFSTFSYFSSNSNSLEKVENFSDSKNAFLTQKKAKAWVFKIQN